MKILLKSYVVTSLVLLGLMLGCSVAYGTALFPYQGGTGTSTVPTTGQPLVGFPGSVYGPGVFIAGSNVTITTSTDGSVTIAATGGGSSVQALPSSTAWIDQQILFGILGGNATSSALFTVSTSTGALNVGGSPVVVQTRNINTTYPITGGASLATDLTIACANCLVVESAPSSTLWGDGQLLFGQLGGTANSSNLFSISTSTGRLSVSSSSLTNVSSTNITASGYVSSPKLVGTGLTSGNCLKAAAGGLITDTGSACSSGGTAAGADTNVQYNGNGAFSATSTFTFSTSTNRLTLGAASSSLFIGSNLNFATTTGATVASSTSFSYTGATSSFTIPTGVTSITITLKGAGGNIATATGVKGFGGSSTGTLAVAQGEVYYFLIGQAGQASTAAYGGGGARGAGTDAAGGGGMTWWGTSGSNATGTAWQSTVLLVAGGGGGGTAGTSGGGEGGGTTGANGYAGGTSNPGAGGTQSAGGAGGVGTNGGTSGADGTAGQGGKGGDPTNQESGGGGGGGYYGGGGGGGQNDASQGGAGAGGSGFVSSTISLTATSTSQGTGSASSTNGSIAISYQIPSTVTVFSTSSAALYVGGHIYTGNQNLATSSVSSCGTSPLINGNDTNGSVFLGSGTAVTSCTVNFGQAFTNAPDCTLGVFSTTIFGGISSESTSSLVVGFSASLGGGRFNYICLDSSE